MGTDYNGAINLLKENYDGYHFTKKSQDIYNPFSLLNALDSSEISSFWFQSGTPTFLVNSLKDQTQPLSELLNERVSEVAISDIDTYKTNPLSLLFQTGYLTIKSYDQEGELYHLGVPNREVEKGLFSELLAYNSDTAKYKLDQKLLEIRKAFRTGYPDKALSIIQSFLASIPADITQNKTEIFFENNLYLLFKLIGMEIQTEKWTSNGRIDLLLSTPDYLYIMELKLDHSAEEALSQINSKNYALPWIHDGRKIFKIGINCSKFTRTLESWIIEE